MKYGKLKSWGNAAPGDVIYVPENAESLEDACTKQKFIDLCNGDERAAEALFSACEWQFPETILDEAMYSDAVDQGQGSRRP